MLRLLLYLGGVVALAVGLSWLADRPGQLKIVWQGQVIDTSVFMAIVILTTLIGLVLIVWSILRHIWESPAAIGSFLSRRREKRGLDSLSSGMIAIGAGDRSGATRFAVQARKTLPNEPLTHLLRAQAAQLSGDKATARRIYEGMLNAPDTEQLGLRGLFLEAQAEGEMEAARQFADRAVRLNPKLTWPVDALFELQCKANDWAGALSTVATARKNGHIEKNSADRRRAVLLTAQAQAAEDTDPEKALQLAVEANGLAPDLVPAAAIAGRIHASRGSVPKATKVIQKTWQKAPHPDLSVAYAYSRLGDSPRDRLERVKKLAGLNPYSLESPIAVATAAIEAKDYAAAREALEPLFESRLTQRVCTLMARIEGEELGDKGRVREWLARAVNAPRDPAWTADGVVAEQWAPVSPVTGALDAFQWRIPVEAAETKASELVAKKLEELVALGAPLASQPSSMADEASNNDEVGAVAKASASGRANSARSGAVEAASASSAAASAASSVEPPTSAPSPSAVSIAADVQDAEVAEVPGTTTDASGQAAEASTLPATPPAPEQPSIRAKSQPVVANTMAEVAETVTATAAQGTLPSPTPARSDAVKPARSVLGPAKNYPKPAAEQPDKPTSRGTAPVVFSSPPRPDDPGTDEQLDTDVTAAAENHSKAKAS
ncbi:MAG: heme biosynthesis HemY N-terminal domain-containing protein [Pseudomonadota bacterium]